MLKTFLIQYISKTHNINVMDITYIKYHNEVDEHYSCRYDYLSRTNKLYRCAWCVVFTKDIKLELRDLKIKQLKQRICLKSVIK